MRDQIRALGNDDIELVAGSGGVFEVEVGGELRFSKKSIGRFPTDDEVNKFI